MKLAAKGPCKHLLPPRVKSNDSMSSQDSFDLSLSVQQPAIVYSGDCVSILAILKSNQTIHFEMDLPLQAAYEVIACERSPLRLQASNYYQSIEWTLQVKAPGLIDFPPLQAKLTGPSSQQTLRTQALSLQVETYPQTLFDNEAIELTNFDASGDTLSSAWLLIPLLLISLTVFFARFRKRGKAESSSTEDIDLMRPQAALHEPVFTPEIAAHILSSISSKTPKELRFHLEALAYRKMSPSQRLELTQTTKSYLEQ